MVYMLWRLPPKKPNPVPNLLREAISKYCNEDSHFQNMPNSGGSRRGAWGSHEPPTPPPPWGSLAGNKDSYKSLGRFEIQQDQTWVYGVSCPWMSEKYP